MTRRQSMLVRLATLCVGLAVFALGVPAANAQDAAPETQATADEGTTITTPDGTTATVTSDQVAQVLAESNSLGDALMTSLTMGGIVFFIVFLVEFLTGGLISNVLPF